MTKKNKIECALRSAVYLISAGWEWPEVEYILSDKFEINGADLRKAYDKYQENKLR